MTHNPIETAIAQLDLSLLKYFFVVATHGGFTRAAKETGISQPALSLGLKKLEKSLGVILVERSERKFTLTAHGLSLLSFCQRLEINLKDVLGALKSNSEFIQKKLKIGTGLSIGFSPFTSMY